MKSLAGVSVTAWASRGLAQTASLPRRRPGELDIHHIDTGCGNCTLIVTPGGTSILVDAGASTSAPETSSTPRPNATRRPGEWQARYALRHAPDPHLDYLVVTHIHPDHVGEIDEASPQALEGPYRLTGVTDVDRLMPIATVIDRSFPNYGTMPPPSAPYAANYLAWLQHRSAHNRRVQNAAVGSDTQIKASGAKLRILSANSAVWTGVGMQSASRFPAHLATTGHSNENSFSVSLRLTCGRFSYFTGGDLSFETEDGTLPWMDVETPVVNVAGRTEVAVADHHGYFDACGPNFVRSLDAQAYIVQAWDIGHPGSAQMQRMTGGWPGHATHDVFATDLLPANALMNRRFAPQLKSRRGHVVVRVAPGGDTYRIFVLDSSNEDDIITATFGPYTCRA